MSVVWGAGASLQISYPEQIKIRPIASNLAEFVFSPRELDSTKAAPVSSVAVLGHLPSNRGGETRRIPSRVKGKDTDDDMRSYTVDHDKIATILVNAASAVPRSLF